MAGVLSIPALCWSGSATAAGWDTPIVYTARHQGMGGTAVAYVDDASAAFHNPAGYAGVEKLELLGSFSLLLGNLTSSPGDYPDATDVESNLVVAPFPLLSGAYRAHEWLTFGLGAFPVASGAADYSYPTQTNGEFDDSLKAVFYELTPGFSLNVPKDKWLPGELSFGAGYRATALSFNRSKSVSGGSTQLDLQLSGWNFTGFRVGLQYSPIPELKFGAVVRNKIKVNATADEGVGLVPLSDIELDFILPLKAGFGARFDYERYGIALDYEYAAQSQNRVVELSGTLPGAENETTLPNHFMWQDGHTVRVGLEYRAPLKTATIPLRAGYVFDGQVGNENYPTAFGTPATSTQSFTLGTGYQRDTWELNLAGAYRFGKTEITDVENECVFCGAPGDYAISLFGIYVDASVEFDL